jgi:hypothetical protein
VEVAPSHRTPWYTHLNLPSYHTYYPSVQPLSLAGGKQNKQESSDDSSSNSSSSSKDKGRRKTQKALLRDKTKMGLRPTVTKTSAQ